MQYLNSYFVACPYCLEQIEIVIDATAGSQAYTEDCEVCCSPILIRIRMEDERVADIEAIREND